LGIALKGMKSGGGVRNTRHGGESTFRKRCFDGVSQLSPLFRQKREWGLGKKAREFLAKRRPTRGGVQIAAAIDYAERPGVKASKANQKGT